MAEEATIKERLHAIKSVDLKNVVVEEKVNLVMANIMIGVVWIFLKRVYRKIYIE